MCKKFYMSVFFCPDGELSEHSWEIKWTFFDFSKWLQWNKEWTFQRGLNTFRTVLYNNNNESSGSSLIFEVIFTFFLTRGSRFCPTTCAPWWRSLTTRWRWRSTSKTTTRVPSPRRATCRTSTSSSWTRCAAILKNTLLEKKYNIWDVRLDTNGWCQR